MDSVLLSLSALILLAVAWYVHRTIPAFTKGASRIAIARTVLVLVGIGFGLTGAIRGEGELLRLLSFLVGFGLVHVPAAIILFIKGRRGEGRS